MPFLTLGNLMGSLLLFLRQHKVLNTMYRRLTKRGRQLLVRRSCLYTVNAGDDVTGLSDKGKIPERDIFSGLRVLAILYNTLVIKRRMMNSNFKKVI